MCILCSDRPIYDGGNNFFCCLSIPTKPPVDWWTFDVYRPNDPIESSERRPAANRVFALELNLHPEFHGNSGGSRAINISERDGGPRYCVFFFVQNGRRENDDVNQMRGSDSARFRRIFPKSTCAVRNTFCGKFVEVYFNVNGNVKSLFTSLMVILTLVLTQSLASMLT